MPFMCSKGAIEHRHENGIGMGTPEFIGGLHREGICPRAKDGSIDHDELILTPIAPEVIQTSRSRQYQLLVLTDGGIRTKAERERVILRHEVEGQ